MAGAIPDGPMAGTILTMVGDGVIPDGDGLIPVLAGVGAILVTAGAGAIQATAGAGVPDGDITLLIIRTHLIMDRIPTENAMRTIRVA